MTQSWQVYTTFKLKERTQRARFTLVRRQPLTPNSVMRPLGTSESSKITKRVRTGSKNYFSHPVSHVKSALSGFSWARTPQPSSCVHIGFATQISVYTGGPRSPSTRLHENLTGGEGPLPVDSPLNRVRREVPDVTDMAATIAREFSDVHWRLLGGPPTGERKAPETARRINTQTRSIYPESLLSSLSSLLPHGTQLRSTSLASDAAVHGVDEGELSEDGSDGSDGSSVSLTSAGTLGDEDSESESGVSFVKSVASWDEEVEEESDGSSASLLSASSSEDEDSESSWGEDSEEESDASSASLASATT
ncbi:hypothetical protein B0H11DRAFT_1918308 [Mycena galericulata]|nr:hypothetical protein B0H11DRAFT_1918308 [Mycena galericulata]